MKKSLLILSISITFLTSLTFLKVGQLMGNNPVKDTVIMGQYYASDVYYSFNNGKISSVPAANWDLAFFISKHEMETAGIWINEVIGTKLYAYKNSDLTGWATLDTTGISTWKGLNNPLKKWNFGAFNVNTTVQFDYGWGKYNVSSHNVDGDSLFVIKVADGTYYKILIVRNDAVNKKYIIRYAKLDNSFERTDTIDYKNSTDRNMVYFSIMGKAAIPDKEPKTNLWDIVFTTFNEEVAPGIFYPSVTVFSNNYKALTAKLTNVNPNTIDYQSAVFNNVISEIGNSWKAANPDTHAYDIVDSVVYFVNDTVGNKIYKLVFNSFGGMTTGKIIFTKEELTTSISNVQKSEDIFSIYPNPANDRVNLVYNINSQNDLNVAIYNLLGTKVYESKIKNNTSGLNINTLALDNLTSGQYIIKINSASASLTQKLNIIR